MRRVMAVALILFCCVTHANAWGNRGHELVAYLAYQHLDPPIKAKVDALIQKNPCIEEWTATVQTLAVADRPAGLFMLAATWPDKIKLDGARGGPTYDCPGHPKFNDKDGADGPDGHFTADIPPPVPGNPKEILPAASQNLGYTDDRRHQYWHFIDTPISGDGTATQPAYQPNVLTEWKTLTQALGSNAASETISLRSYDLVWVEHLTGDIHQPLHDAARFTAALPNGDEGGNLVVICPASKPKCGFELHAYWDNLPGSSSSTLTSTMTVGNGLNQRPAPDPVALDMDHPEHWATAAWKLAVADAYAPPFKASTKLVDPSAIPATYHSKAIGDMKDQVFLAGWRLATILNSSLKNWPGN